MSSYRASNFAVAGLFNEEYEAEMHIPSMNIGMTVREEVGEPMARKLIDVYYSVAAGDGELVLQFDRS